MHPNPHEVIERIRQGNVVAKTVSFTSNKGSIDSPDRLLFLLEQLARPAVFRPTKGRKQTIEDRSILFQGREVIIRSKPEKLHTKKTAVTLLPPDGKIKLYMPSQKNPVGLLFQLDLCDLKGERYIFPGLAKTDHGNNRHTAQRISLANLRTQLEHQSAKNKISPPNQLDIGLSRSSLIGIFAPIDDPKTIGFAIQAQAIIQQYLGLQLPLFIITPNRGIQIYSPLTMMMETNLALTTVVKSGSAVKKKQLIDMPNEMLYLIFNYLSYQDLSRLSQTNRNLFQTIYSNGIILNRLIIDRFNNQITQNNFSQLRAIAIQSSYLSTALLANPKYNQHIPEFDKVRTVRKVKNKALGVLHAALGLIIGLGLGLLSTLYYWTLALVRLALDASSMCSFSGLYCKTSQLRTLMSVVIFPIISIISSILIATYFSYRDGIHLNKLTDGLSVLHNYLYFGTSPGDSTSEDPWSIFTPYDATIAQTPNLPEEIGHCFPKPAPRLADIGFFSPPSIKDKKSKNTPRIIELSADSEYEPLIAGRAG